MSVAVYSSQGMFADYLDQVSHSKQSAELENKLTEITESHAEKPKERVLSGSSLLFETNKNMWLAKKDYPDGGPDYIEKFMRKVTFYRASYPGLRRLEQLLFQLLVTGTSRYL